MNEHESIYSYHFFRLLRKPVPGMVPLQFHGAGTGIGRDEPLPGADEATAINSPLCSGRCISLSAAAG
ncbi:MAG: hypothetical protein MZV63_23470 [Marinilabiliales bacterium]|nr:hypothetical protein [Marinilabiliales bacterium]